MANTPKIGLKIPSTADNIAEQINIDTPNNLGIIDTEIDWVKTQINDLDADSVGLGNVDNIKQMPISGGILENYTEKLITLDGTTPTLNLSNGNNFVHTLSDDTTYTISNAVNSVAHSFTLILTQPETAVTVTFPISVKWQNDEAPDLEIDGSTHILSFMTVNGGTTWLEVGRVSYDVS